MALFFDFSKFQYTPSSFPQNLIPPSHLFPDKNNPSVEQYRGTYIQNLNSGVCGAVVLLIPHTPCMIFCQGLLSGYIVLILGLDLVCVCDSVMC